MSLVPSSSSGAPTLDSIRQALSMYKGALDERDGWEVLAAADEAKRMAVRPAASPVVKQVGRPAVAGKSKTGRGAWPPQRAPKIPKRIGRTIYWRKETIQSVVSVTTATNAAAAVTINLGLCPAATALASIYDLYWIVRVRYTLANLLYPTANTNVPFVNLVPEYTGAAPNPTAVQDYPGLKRRALMTGQQISLTAYPRYTAEVGGSTFTSSDAGWLNTTTTSTPWYGVSYSIPAVTAALEGSLEMWIAFANGD